MSQILLKLIQLRSEAPAQYAASYSRSTTATVTFFILAVIACNALYYPAVTRRLNDSIKGTRSLLLLLPDDVVVSVPTLKQTMLAITKRLTA